MELKRTFTSDSRTSEPIQAHLWHEMSINELQKQRDLVNDEINRIRDIMSQSTYSISLTTILRQAQDSLARLDLLIEHNNEQKNSQKPRG